MHSKSHLKFLQRHNLQQIEIEISDTKFLILYELDSDNVQIKLKTNDKYRLNFNFLTSTKFIYDNSKNQINIFIS